MRRKPPSRLASDLLTACGEPPQTQSEALSLVHAMYPCAGPRFARVIARKIMEWR